jgi:hypothetical protein
MKCGNILWRQKPHSCQMHHHKSDRLTSVSRRRHRQSSFAFLSDTLATVRRWFEIFRHPMHCAVVHSGMTDIGCYVKSRQISLCNYLL